jgi:hypothetical protein
METVSKTFYGFTSKNGNTIAKTVIGLMWIRNGRILRPATTYEWDFAQTWGSTKIVGNVSVRMAKLVWAEFYQNGKRQHARVTAVSVDTIRGCDPEKFMFTIKLDGRRFAFYYTHYDRLQVFEPTQDQWRAISYAAKNIDVVAHSPSMTGQKVGALTSRCVTTKQAYAMGMGDMVEIEIQPQTMAIHSPSGLVDMG